LQPSASVAAIPVELFDASDGYPAPGFSRIISPPTIAIAGDGKVWVSGQGGLAWIDSTSARRPAVAPPVVIQSLVSGGLQHDAHERVSLTKGTRGVEIDYTALNYSHPDRLRFRYRLDGVEDSWVDVGTRRQAFYSNLGPGTYRFHVNVTDERGAWTESSAALEFVIPPTFVQSRVFLALCIACGLGIIALVYRFRVHQLTLRERLLAENRMRERTQERERIARELHDTLLQSNQALILQVHAIAKDLPRNEPTRDKLEEVLDRADEVMDEGRDRVAGLRNSEDRMEDLPVAIAALAKDLAHGAAEFHLHVEGAKQPVRRQVADEVCSIVREALLNAFRHADAHLVEVRLIYSSEALRIVVRDDGRGIEASTLESGKVSGHWGLPGMKERAKQLDATLQIQSAPGRGTELELEMPARLAHERSASRVQTWGWLSRLIRRSN
jgi:signal transduction histidine kinase